MNKEASELLNTMYDMANNPEKCISLLQNAFIYNSSKPMKDCCGMVEAIKRAVTETTFIFGGRLDAAKGTSIRMLYSLKAFNFYIGRQV